MIQPNNGSATLTLIFVIAESLSKFILILIYNHSVVKLAVKPAVISGILYVFDFFFKYYFFRNFFNRGG